MLPFFIFVLYTYVKYAIIIVCFAKEMFVVNDIAKQLEKILKDKANKFNKLPLEKQFSKEFLRKNHFNGDINKLFETAEVDIHNINNLSKEEEKRLVDVLRPHFKSWKDFVGAALQYFIDHS